MKRQLNLGILLLVLAIFGWFAVVRPQMRVFSDRALQAKAKSVEAKSYDARLANLQLLKSQGATVQSTLNALYLAMPKLSQIPEVLVMMENIGSNSGVVFTAVTVGTPTGDAGGVASDDPTSTAQVPVSISFNGNLANVNQFLSAVHNNIRTAIVKNQTISADKTGNMSVTMQLGLIYQGN